MDVVCAHGWRGGIDLLEEEEAVSEGIERGVCPWCGSEFGMEKKNGEEGI